MLYCWASLTGQISNGPPESETWVNWMCSVVAVLINVTDGVDDSFCEFVPTMMFYLYFIHLSALSDRNGASNNSNRVGLLVRESHCVLVF